MARNLEFAGRPATIFGDEADNYFRMLGDQQPFEDDVYRICRLLLPADGVAFDVGANIGLYSVGLSLAYPRATVYSFEPAPSVCALLRKNVAHNQVGRVRVEQLALSDAPGEIDFYENADYAAGSLMVDRADVELRDHLSSWSPAAATPAGGFCTVHATTVDDYVTANRIERLDLLKIDAEGADLRVIRGARQTIERLRPLVVVEFGSFALSMHARMLPVDALRELRQTFERLMVIEPVGLSELITPSDDIRFLHHNATVTPVSDLLCGFKNDDRIDRAVAQFDSPPDSGVPVATPGEPPPPSPPPPRSWARRLLDRPLPQAARRWLLAPVLAAIEQSRISPKQ